MEKALVSAAIALIEYLLPNITSSAAVQKVIDLLVQLVPVIVSGFREMLPMVKNVIAYLSGHAATTIEQLDQLDALEKDIDADFEDIAAKVEAEDAAAAATDSAG